MAEQAACHLPERPPRRCDRGPRARQADGVVEQGHRVRRRPRPRRSRDRRGSRDASAPTRELDVAEDSLKKTAAWTAEKLGRLEAQRPARRLLAAQPHDRVRRAGAGHHRQEGAVEGASAGPVAATHAPPRSTSRRSPPGRTGRLARSRSSACAPRRSRSRRPDADVRAVARRRAHDLHDLLEGRPVLVRNGGCEIPDAIVKRFLSWHAASGVPAQVDSFPVEVSTCGPRAPP